MCVDRISGSLYPETTSVFQGYTNETVLEGTFRRYFAIPAYLAAKVRKQYWNSTDQIL